MLPKRYKLDVLRRDKNSEALFEAKIKAIER